MVRRARLRAGLQTCVCQRLVMGQAIQFGFVAAIYREVKPLVSGWQRTRISEGGRAYDAFSTEGAALICAGIGDARVATKVLIERFDPKMVVSIGFAGSLDAGLTAPSLMIPSHVIEEASGVEFATGLGAGRLVTAEKMADAAAKRELAARFKASAVDMEASMVAEVAESRRREFLAIRAISDDLDADVSFVGDFIENGGFNMAAFIAHIAVRPRLWGAVRELQVNSRRAQEVLCSFVAHIIKNPKELASACKSEAGSGIYTPAS